MHVYIIPMYDEEIRVCIAFELRMTMIPAKIILRLFTHFYGNPNLLEEMILVRALISTSQTVCKSTQQLSRTI
jgi:hypothetical protein